MLLHAIFRGIVQGVGFRFFVEKKAKEFGIKGFVRNLPDGTVEVMAEGDKDTLERFFNEIKDGPPLASVTSIDYEYIDKEGGFRDFEIKY